MRREGNASSARQIAGRRLDFLRGTEHRAARQERPHADGSPMGTLGPQSPTPTGSEPLASDIGAPRAANGAAVN